jgi:hypothetical protein
MRPVCERILSDPDIEIGWHTQAHLNCFTASRDDVKRDMEHAERVRRELSIRLTAMAFPYNAVGYLDEVLSSGFTKLRGYIGQYKLPFTVRFKGFTFCGTTLFLGPRDVKTCRKGLDSPFESSNLFLHPVDWIRHDLQPLRDIFLSLAQRDERGIQ